MEIEKLVLLLVGGVIGFIASIAKDYFVEKTKRKYKEIELKREKAEELYILLEKWANFFFFQKNHLVLVMNGHIDYNEYLDYIINEGEKNKVDFKRIDMIINIYFDKLLSFDEKVRKQMEIVNDIEYEYKKEYENGNIDGKQYINLLLSETLKTTESIDKIKKEVCILVKELN
jgi:hypothetical protein